MRRLSLYVVSALAIFAALSMTAAGVRAQVKPTLPEISSYALDKSKVTLPADLRGTQNVVILYFEPDQSDDALAWARELEAIRTDNPGLGSYILPVYGKENFLFRWWIDASIRSSAPANEDRHTTIPIFVDKSSFLKSVGVSGEKEPAVLLMDRNGRIEWKTQGRYENGRLAELAAWLRSDSHAVVATHAVMSNAGFDVRARRP